MSTGDSLPIAPRKGSPTTTCPPPTRSAILLPFVRLMSTSRCTVMMGRRRWFRPITGNRWCPHHWYSDRSSSHPSNRRQSSRSSNLCSRRHNSASIPSSSSTSRNRCTDSLSTLSMDSGLDNRATRYILACSCNNRLTPMVVSSSKYNHRCRGTRFISRSNRLTFSNRTSYYQRRSNSSNIHR